MPATDPAPPWTRIATGRGLTVLAVGDGAPGVTAEAWLGDGGDGGALAHLAEHVALAQARSPVLDGRVTPAATILRARAATFEDAIAPLWAAMTATRVEPAALAGETRAIAGEDAARSRSARLGAALWRRTMRAPHGSRRAPTPAAVEAWWRGGWRARPCTLVVRGAVALEALAAWAARWPGTACGPWAVEGAGADRAAGPALLGAAAGLDDDDGWALGVAIPGLTAASLPALAVAAAALRGAGGGPAELIAGAHRGLVAVAGAGARRVEGPAPGDRAAWAEARGRAARLPVPGVAGAHGALGLGQHVAGDPAWAARHRAAVGAVTDAEAAALAAALAERMHGIARLDRPESELPRSRAAISHRDHALVTQSSDRQSGAPHTGLHDSAPRAARGAGHAVATHGAGRWRVARQAGPGAPPPRGPGAPPRGPTHRATTGGARLAVATDATAGTVAIRIVWPGGLAAETADTRGTTALAAAAIAGCGEPTVVGAYGGTLAAIVERDRFGVRVELPAASWRDGLAALAACLAAPSPSARLLATERDRLDELAAAAAGSALRTGLAAFARAQYGEHPLARELVGAPAPYLLPHAIDRWLAARYPLGRAVIAAVGALELADLEAALAPLLAAPLAGDAGPIASATAPIASATAPIAPPRRPAEPAAPTAPRELFVDAAFDGEAVVIGFPALAAGDPDRAVLDVLAALLDDPAGPLAALAGAGPVRRVAVADTADAGYLAVALDRPTDRAAARAAALAALAALAAAPPDAAAVAALRDRLLAARGAGPLRLRTWADDLAIAELVGAPDRHTALAAVDAGALARVARRVLVPAAATVATVRRPDITPGVRHRRDQPVPRRHRARRR